MQPTIWTVTPCFNAAATIDSTIASVLLQTGDFRINYHVQDSGSTDGILDRLNRWHPLSDSAALPLCSNVNFTYSSAKDEGHYAAIAESFSAFTCMPPDDWLTWINADDILLPGAFALMAGIASQDELADVRWVTGAAAVARDSLQIAFERRPFALEIAAAGPCDGIHWSYLHQEGTFFRSSVWSDAEGKHAFDEFALAGDWNLWRTIAQSTEIYSVNWPLGVFSKRAGQLSEVRRDEYNLEIDRTVSVAKRRKSLSDLSGKKSPAIFCS